MRWERTQQAQESAVLRINSLMGAAAGKEEASGR